MKAKTFTGGYKFKRFKGEPDDKLASLDPPPQVFIPLFQGFGTPLEPQVNVGDKVYAGQIIAQDDNRISSPILSSISGSVTSIEKKNYFMREVTMVAIEGDPETAAVYEKLAGHSPNWESIVTFQNSGI